MAGIVLLLVRGSEVSIAMGGAVARTSHSLGSPKQLSLYRKIVSQAPVAMFFSRSGCYWCTVRLSWLCHRASQVVARKLQLRIKGSYKGISLILLIQTNCNP